MPLFWPWSKSTDDNDEPSETTPLRRRPNRQLNFLHDDESEMTWGRRIGEIMMLAMDWKTFGIILTLIL